jgi:virginiamycin B lyase
MASMDRSSLGRTSFERRSRSLVRALLGSAIGLLAGLLLPATALAIEEFPVPTPSSQPSGITVGPDGALWFTEENGNRIGRITTAGSISEFAQLPNPGSLPSEIVTGPDGALWFTEFGANKIARITTAGAITEYTVPTIGSGPDGIAVGPDGNLWFTEYQQNKIARIDPNNPGTPGGAGNITEFSAGLSSASGPGDIVTGPDGRLWFTQAGSNSIGAITTGGSITEYQIPSAGSENPSGIANSFGALWFTESAANKIGRISTTGSFTEFPIATPGSGPASITLGPDGALWFTEHGANKIGRITTGGSVSEFAVPTASSGPDGIAAGPDGALWFTELFGNKIGRIQAAAPAPLPPPPPPPPAANQATPNVLSLAVSPSKFRAAPRGSSIARAKVGATVTYRLSVAATTRFTVERERAGRKKGKRCVPQTRRNRRARRCKRYVTVRGSFSHRGKAGSNRFKFTGRLARKRLRPARYRLVAVATAGSTKSKLKRANFRIVRH